MRKLIKLLPKNSGRNRGTVTVRHQGGRKKRFLREIDFKRDKKDIWGKVEGLEYDPNRNVQIALVLYEDGERRYILAPEGIAIGTKVISSELAPIELGNTLSLAKIPIGTSIHNIELRSGMGGQIVRSAGSVAIVQSKEADFVLIKLPSAEVRKFRSVCLATIGQLGNIEVKNRKLKKAGTKRHMGIRPSVRGVAMHPHAHPHGGGEGRSSVGMKFPKTVYGKKAVGNTRNKKKYSNKLIIKRRKLGSHH